MKIKIQSTEKFLREQILSETIGRESDEYSNILNYSMDELIKLNMRKIAKDEYLWKDKDILSESIALTKSTLHQECKAYDLDFDFSKYFKETKQRLKPVAKEISDLRENLIKAKRVERIGAKEVIISKDDKLTFDIVEIGLKGLIEGLILTPNFEFDMDTERIKENYNLADDWFPFEIKIDYFTFILDDDGTIFVSTDNLPKELVHKSKELLKNLASNIYTDIK